MCTLRGVVLIPLAITLSLSLHAVEAPDAEPATTPPAVEDKTPGRIRDGLLIGAVGLAVTAAYTVGAVLAGDHPAGHTLAIIGGITSLGLVSGSLAAMIMAWRDNPWGVLQYALVALGVGLAGAAVGGIGAHFAAQNPGAGRTATHGVIIGLCVTETVLIELSRLVRP